MSNVFHYGCRTSWFIFSDRLQNSLSLLNSIYTLMKYSGTPTPLSSYYHIYFSGSNISTGCLQKASNILPLLHHICSDPCRFSFICKSFLYMVWVPCFARYQKIMLPHAYTDPKTLHCFTIIRIIPAHFPNSWPDIAYMFSPVID